ncbi:SUMO1 sentrin specific peptidase 8 [Chytridiales sp. JEL 0842]|nr:SUMO1 sentrin specific peptidase 8 [Chytridiales sp. JEL 0842]
MPPLLLQYGDVVIRQSDLDLLQEGNWLNDTLIEFIYEYLENKWASSPRPFAFLRPAIVHLLSNAYDTSFLESVFEGLKLENKEVIFIPINDNSNEGAGGSHWSLLVFYRPSQYFYYYDSMGKYNLTSAKRAMGRLYPMINKSKHASANGQGAREEDEEEVDNRDEEVERGGVEFDKRVVLQLVWGGVGKLNETLETVELVSASSLDSHLTDPPEVEFENRDVGASEKRE